MRIVPPGSTVGVLGSGQLGRMFALAARTMGYRVHTYSPEQDSPTGHVADVEVSAPYEDLDALRAFARRIDVLTFEFENVPRAALDEVERLVPVHPSSEALWVSQNREREKDFLRKVNAPVAGWASVRNSEELASALSSVGAPAVLKTAAFGYDGKGQEKISSKDERRRTLRGAASAGRRASSKPSSSSSEKSRSSPRAALTVASCSFLPSRTSTAGTSSTSLAVPPLFHHSRKIKPTKSRRAILEALSYIGVLCVELFHTKDGALLVNEVAPRPHNSGHLTIDACVTSQFEQQLRAVCGLPLGSTELLRPAAMANLLGDLWTSGEPRWENACATPGVALHLYGKKEARPGRKMGHLTALAATPDEARRKVLGARASLTR